MFLFAISGVDIYFLLVGKIAIHTNIFAPLHVNLVQLNKKYDPEDKHHIVRVYDYFVYRRHLCICFELLGTNL